MSAEAYIAAIATDGECRLIEKHFGDAACYELYSLSKEGARRIGPLTNTVDEEDPNVHADPVKAKGISGLLKEAGVQVAVARTFGPNIKRIRKQFVCVVVDRMEAEEAAAAVSEHFDELDTAWREGEDRKHLVFRASP